jgi:hypothetical protein
MAAGWRNPLAIEHSPAGTYEQQKADEGRAKRRPRHRRTISGSSSDNSAAEELPLAKRSPVAMGVVVATSLYCGAKAGIQVTPCGVMLRLGRFESSICCSI